jgi:Holliday junction resolvasome RuvABC endonuclease subunit
MDIREQISSFRYSVLGVDQSLTHTAATHLCSAEPEQHLVRHFSVETDAEGFPHDYARLSHIMERFTGEVRLCAGSDQFMAAEYARWVFMEGYSMGSKTGRERLGELGGQLRLWLFRTGWNLVVVPPTTLKKYVSGKGNSEKNAMMMEVLARWGHKSSDDNAADGYALARFGIEYVAHFVHKLPSGHEFMAARDKVQVYLNIDACESWVHPKGLERQRKAAERAALKAAKKTEAAAAKGSRRRKVA